MTESSIILAILLACSAALHLGYKALPPRTRGLASGVFLCGAFFGLILGIFAMTCGIERGNYCDRCPPQTTSHE